MNPETAVERFEVKIRPAFKARLAAEAQKEGITLGEMLVRAACRGISFPEEDAVPTRKLPGRKPKLASEPPRSKRSRTT
jgi:hypothetical protein